MDFEKYKQKDITKAVHDRLGKTTCRLIKINRESNLYEVWLKLFATSLK